MQIATSAHVMTPFFRPVSYLFDTDWIVHYLRGKRQDSVSRIQELVPQGLAVSSITLAELYRGVYSSERQQENLRGLQDFLSLVRIFDLDRTIAELFGKEKVRLQEKGTPIDNFDLLIGCTALQYNLILLTNNRKHFDRIEGLRVESL